jgi:hypothetical protein
MNLNSVFLLKEKQVSELLEQWLVAANLSFDYYDSKVHEDLVQGLVVLTEGLDVDRQDQELIDFMEARRTPVRKIDLNGTIQAAVSGLDLWLKNSKSSTIILTGSDAIKENENLIRFLNRLTEIQVSS